MPDAVSSEAEAVADAEVHEAADEAVAEVNPVEHASDSDLTVFQKKCIAGYAKDPYFTDEQKLCHLTKLNCMWWSNADKLVILDAFDSRQFIMCEMHDTHTMDILAARRHRRLLSDCILGQRLLLM